MFSEEGLGFYIIINQTHTQQKNNFVEIIMKINQLILGRITKTGTSFKRHYKVRIQCFNYIFDNSITFENNFLIKQF